MYRLIETYLVEEQLGDDANDIKEKAIKQYSGGFILKGLKAIIVNERKSFDGLTKVEIYSL